MAHIWLRAESKQNERRAILVPQHAKALIDNGYQVTVEKSSQRIFKDCEYEKVGCKLVDTYTWPDAPEDAYILGLKEIPVDTFNLKHKHIYFAHAYAGQKGSHALLKRYKEGGGIHYDLEFLVDFKGDQLLTKGAGYWAGVCGANLALEIWGQKILGFEPPFSISRWFSSYDLVVHHIKDFLKKIKITPSVLIIGPNGMVGSGVRKLLDEISCSYRTWTRNDIPESGPLNEILNYNIFFNCIKIENSTPVFLNHNSIKNNSELSVIADISCEPLHPNNPLPIYSNVTTFDNPTCRVGGNIDILGIDNITSLLPNECSYILSECIFPYICELILTNGKGSKPSAWSGAISSFYNAIKGI